MICPACQGIGWFLIDQHAGDGNDSGPVTLDLVPCPLPECEAADDIRPIATLGIRGMFTTVVRHPATNAVTALTGFTEPVYR